MIEELLEKRILVLDGAMGTMLQAMGGTNDENVEAVHKAYIESGADIICTNTFVANEGNDIYDTNIRFCRLARKAADGCRDRKIFVAGSVGPSNKTLVMSEDCDFDALQQAYFEQINALADGGADVLLFETVFDTLNLKAALTAASKTGRNLPLMVSATVEKSGRLLSGQTLEAFVTTVLPFKPLSIGLNCSFGAKDMYPHLKRLSEISPTYISSYPNAGLPNKFGGYDESPESMAAQMERFFSEGLLNVAGGCCGTTPAHIELLAEMSRRYAPHRRSSLPAATRLAGLESMTVDKFTHVGERTNVAGSKKFARLVEQGDYEEALSVARRQVEGGAQIIDVCMDAAMLDAKKAMSRFLFLAGGDPNIAKVPVMIDSSDWNVLMEGLKHTQGKSIVNSISLKEGEETFLKKAGIIKSFGAAVVVMAFDESGQADSLQRRKEICTRAYRLLVEKAGFPPEDIIFDPNVLTIATGMPEHDHYAVDFIEAVRYIKQNLPFAKTSGGISNLSFSFRGNNPVREAMHSVFLYHAVQAGLDMAIVNPEMLEVYDNINPGLLQKVEDVVLDRYPGATDALIEYAASHKGDMEEKKNTAESQWRGGSLQDRLEHALVNGISDFLQTDIEEALKDNTALDIIENMLMKGIGRVGGLFGEGKMFLPQVVKSAQVMKKAVSYLLPHIPEGNASGNRPKVVLATVRGDVHDIGKNIVGVVLSCNGYDVVDLGVMVPKETIADEAVRNNAAAICVSGLITPSLNEMVELARELEDRGLDIPLVVGGATTSEAHTAAFIDPEYSGAVVRASDASENTGIVGNLLSYPDYKLRIKEKYKNLRERMAAAETVNVRDKSVDLDWNNIEIPEPAFTGVKYFKDISEEDYAPYVNWKAFCAAWQVRDEEASALVDEAKSFLTRYQKEFANAAAVGIFPAHSCKDDIIVADEIINTGRRNGLSLADFVSPEAGYAGAFAIKCDASRLSEYFASKGDTYEQLMTQLLADRVAEALSEYMFEKMRKELWGFDKGIRPAVGYPVLPDHSVKAKIFRLLDAEKSLGMKLTETYAMIPQSSVCGLYIVNDAAKYF